MMTTGMLLTEARKMARQYWGLEFNLPVVANSRLTRALGRFVYQVRSHTPLKIEVSTQLLNNYDDETVLDVLKHELTHWALFVQNKPHHDGDFVFEKELRRVGASSTNTITPQGELHTLTCKKCNKVVLQKHKQTQVMKYLDSRYTSKCCGATLQYAGQHEFTTGKLAQQTTQESKQEPKKVVAKQSNLNDLVQPGPRGVTNAQMIPAIKKALDAGSIVQLQMLKNNYPEVYAGSLRYLGKGYTNRYNELIVQRRSA